MAGRSPTGAQHLDKDGTSLTRCREPILHSKPQISSRESGIDFFCSDSDSMQGLSVEDFSLLPLELLQ